MLIIMNSSRRPKMRRLRKTVISYLIFILIAAMSKRSDQAIIKITGIAEYFCIKDYYKRIIRRIRNLFYQGHPSLKIAKTILNDINPNQKTKIIQNFIINQLLSGTNKRQEYLLKEGIYPPGFGVISPSMKCNLHCYGCYSALYDKSRELSFNEIDDILNQMKEMGIYFAVISGGEPFYSEAVARIFKKHDDMAFMVYTNGSLINAGLADFIAETGNILPCISVEGFKQETDKRRGKGHFDMVIRAMDLLRERNLAFGFSATLTRDNSDIITSDRFIDFYIQKGALVGWYFHYMPTGINPDLNLLPTPKQRDNLRKRVEYFRENKEILLGDFQNDGPLVGGCIAAGRKYFHINNNGDIEPCTFLHYATNNIRTSSLKDALKSDFFQYIRKCQSSNENLLRPCTILDHPEFSRNAIRKCNAYPTHAGAESTFTILSDDLDKYASSYAKIADKAWAKIISFREKDRDEQI